MTMEMRQGSHTKTLRVVVVGVCEKRSVYVYYVRGVQRHQSAEIKGAEDKCRKL